MVTRDGDAAADVTGGGDLARAVVIWREGEEMRQLEGGI